MQLTRSIDKLESDISEWITLQSCLKIFSIYTIPLICSRTILRTSKLRQYRYYRQKIDAIKYCNRKANSIIKQSNTLIEQSSHTTREGSQSLSTVKCVILPA